MAEIMSCEAVREAILAGKSHSGGLKMQACLALDDGWFQRIRQDVLMLVADRQASDVGDKNHPTNWVRPYGKATQYNLYNGTGDTADIHSYHQGTSGASFVEPRAEALYDFVKCFESRLLNLRLNGLMPGSGLNPHEEGIVNGEKVVCRFHLPLFTNEQCSLLLDEENFYFRPGIVYFFNKGCVHGARNESGDVRYHLVWDMWLDQWIYETIFNLDDAAVPGEGFRKLSHNEAAELARSTPQPVDEYMIGMSDGQLLLAKKSADRWIKRAVSEVDILPAESPLRIVESWYPAERYGGEIFRWVNDGALFEISAESDGTAEVNLLLEAGPSCDGRCTVTVLDDFSCELACLQLAGRQEWHMTLPVHQGHGNRYRLQVSGGGKPVAGDPRILNFRVFRMDVALPVA